MKINYRRGLLAAVVFIVLVNMTAFRKTEAVAARGMMLLLLLAGVFLTIRFWASSEETEGTRKVAYTAYSLAAGIISVVTFKALIWP